MWRESKYRMEQAGTEAARLLGINRNLDETNEPDRIRSAFGNRMRAMASLATVCVVLFGFSATCMLLPDVYVFHGSIDQRRFTILLATTVLLSAFSAFVYVSHYYVGERLISEGMPELAWKILVRTFIVRITRVLADISTAACCSSFIAAVFLKTIDSLKKTGGLHQDLPVILNTMALVVGIGFIVLMLPLFVLYQRRP